MIIKLLLMRLSCFLYIVLFVVPLVFLSYMDTIKRFVIIDDISSGECKIQIPIQRIQCTQCKSTHALLPINFVPYTQFTYLFIHYSAVQQQSSVIKLSAQSVLILNFINLTLPFLKERSLSLTY